jgi:hypothetical protein
VRVAGDDHLVVLVGGSEQGLRQVQRLGHDEEQRPAVGHPDAGRLLVDPAAGTLDVEPGRTALVLEVPLELQGDRADLRVAGQQIPRPFIEQFQQRCHEGPAVLTLEDALAGEHQRVREVDEDELLHRVELVAQLHRVDVVHERSGGACAQPAFGEDRPHFTAPAVIPETMCRCRSRKAMTIGADTTSDAAITWFQ